MTTRALALAAILLLATAGLHTVSRPETPPPRQVFAEFPIQIEGWWSQQDAPLDPEVMAVLRVDDYLNRTYKRGSGELVSFYIGYFRSQRVGQTVHSPMVCMPGSGWQPQRSERLLIPLQAQAEGGPPRTQTIEVNRLVVQNGSQQRHMVLYWYQSGRRVVASDYTAKVYKFVDAVRHNRSDGALVRAIAPIGPGPDAERVAERQVVEFVQQAFPLLKNFIPS